MERLKGFQEPESGGPSKRPLQINQLREPLLCPSFTASHPVRPPPVKPTTSDLKGTKAGKRVAHFHTVVVVLVVVRALVDILSPCRMLAGMVVAEPQSVELPVLAIEFGFATLSIAEFAQKVGWVVPVAIVRDGAWPLNGQSASR